MAEPPFNDFHYFITTRQIHSYSFSYATEARRIDGRTQTDSRTHMFFRHPGKKRLYIIAMNDPEAIGVKNHGGSDYA